MCEIQVTSGHWYEIRLSLKPVKGASTSLCRHTSQCTYIVYAHTLNIFRLVNRHNEAHPYSEDFKMVCFPSLSQVRVTLSSLQSSSLKNVKQKKIH